MGPKGAQMRLRGRLARTGAPLGSVSGAGVGAHGIHHRYVGAFVAVLSVDIGRGYYVSLRLSGFPGLDLVFGTERFAFDGHDLCVVEQPVKVRRDDRTR